MTLTATSMHTMGRFTTCAPDFGRVFLICDFILFFCGKRVTMNIYNKSLLSEDTLSLAA